MRTGIQIEVAAADRTRLEAIVADRKRRQKHIERRGGRGTPPIMRQVAVAGTLHGRGVAGLLQDKSGPPGRTPLPRAAVERVVELTLRGPPGEATH